MRYIIRELNRCDVGEVFEYSKEIDLEGDLLGCMSLGTVIGYIYYVVEDSNIDILLLEVIPEFRRKGIGSLLLKTLLERYPNRTVALIPDSYDSTEFFKNRVKEGLLPSDTSLEG